MTRLPYATALAMSASLPLLRLERRRAKPRVGARRQRDVTVRHLLFVARRQDEVLAAFALVHAGGADVFDRRLPGVVDAAGDRVFLIRRRDLQHHRPDVLGVVEREDVDRVGIGRERLVLPRQRPRPVDDLVEVAAALLRRIEHELRVDRRHAPDDGLDGAAMQATFGELVRGERRDGFCTGLEFLLLTAGRDHQPAKQSPDGEQRRAGHCRSLLHGDTSF